MGRALDRMSTYVFCLIAAAKGSARRGRLPSGLPGMGRVRSLDLGGGLTAIVADAPVGRYSEAVINRRLSDLEWVSRAAVAHERVVEHFRDAAAVLPMKLFTIFRGDERALEDLGADRARIDAVVRRVGQHDEWGVRVLFDGTRVVAGGRSRRDRGRRTERNRQGAGVAYLIRKKARRDAALEFSSHARDTVAALYDQLARQARSATRQSVAALPQGQRGALLLDAAFLVARARAGSFRGLAGRRARALAKQGYTVTLTGPWPPYTFVQD
jgi:hypothetical protein